MDTHQAHADQTATSDPTFGRPPTYDPASQWVDPGLTVDGLARYWLKVCSACGAAVMSEEKHDAFHAALRPATAAQVLPSVSQIRAELDKDAHYAGNGGGRVISIDTAARIAAKMIGTNW